MLGLERRRVGCDTILGLCQLTEYHTDIRHAQVDIVSRFWHFLAGWLAGLVVAGFALEAWFLLNAASGAYYQLIQMHQQEAIEAAKAVCSQV